MAGPLAQIGSDWYQIGTRPISGELPLAELSVLVRMESGANCPGGAAGDEAGRTSPNPRDTPGVGVVAGIKERDVLQPLRVPPVNGGG